jgi:hypothetical protein
MQLRIMASGDWMKQDYIIKEGPGPLILDATTSVDPYDAPNVFQDETLYAVPIQCQASIYN